MKTKLIALLGIMVFAVSAFTYGVPFVRALASPSWIAIIQTATATTTRAFMTPGTATSTFNLYDSTKSIPNDSNVDSIQLNIAFSASTTASALQWQYQWSNNGNDWYGENLASQSTASLVSTEASTTLTHLFVPNNSVSTTTYRTVTLPVVPAYYTRVQFSVPLGTNNGAVWAEAVLKHNSAGQ